MSLIEAAISWLTPLDCVVCGIEGEALCLACANAEILPYGERCFSCGALSIGSRTCKSCRRLGAPTYVWVSTDYAGVAKDLIVSYKFNHNRSAAGNISSIMAESLLSFNNDSDLEQKRYVLVPVPTASSRVRQRGFDHSMLLARKLAEELGAAYSPALVRHGQAQQVGANRSVRFAQAASAYSVKDVQAIRGKNILLVDDVVTTGATLSGAARQLRKAGAKSVNALIFAKRL
jgi:ComF family protein